MRQKELRIALVCYGGVSLAVYMHGVTKELWHLARASRAFHAGEDRLTGSEAVYARLLRHVQDESDLRLRVLPDILSGASAGGINAVFLAQAIHSGQSLEPLTDLWLKNADVDRLTASDARPVWRFAKFWAQPFATWLLSRPGNAVSESVAPETREEVRTKVSRFVRGRWFAPPFSGLGFARLLENAFAAMAEAPVEHPLLPPGHPLDLFVTATDFRGYLSLLRLHSPPVAEESEHRVPISFQSRTPAVGGIDIADPLSLVLAARATASFPGAFPPATMAEMDELCEKTGRTWAGRDAFIARVLPMQRAQNRLDALALIDGSVLVNKPFEGAIAALQGRPAQREVDRRFVYIDPRPHRFEDAVEDARPVGFFATIFGALSTIPREQPISDNLEQLEAQSREALRLQRLLATLRPEVDAAVDTLFGRTLFLDRPTPKRLRAWRARAQQAAAQQAGYAFEAYSQAKMAGIVTRLAKLLCEAGSGLGPGDRSIVEGALREELGRRGLDALGLGNGKGLKAEAITFLRAHDIAFRIRRLRLLSRRLARDWERDPEISNEALEKGRETIFEILALYFEREDVSALGPDFAEAAHDVINDPDTALDLLAERRLLPEVDDQAEVMLASALETMPTNLKRRMLLTYLGFPFYDTATLVLTHNESLTEFDPVKVDRISPEDARSIREGGTAATLRGTEFYNFGAFFSRAYRENDYLWGRLHGAERMVDLVFSTVEGPVPQPESRTIKRDLFLAILDEERASRRCDENLIESLRKEVLGRLS